MPGWVQAPVVVGRPAKKATRGTMPAMEKFGQRLGGPDPLATNVQQRNGRPTVGSDALTQPTPYVNQSQAAQTAMANTKPQLQGGFSPRGTTTAPSLRYTNAQNPSGNANMTALPQSAGGAAKIPGAAGKAIEFAKTQIGDPYIWGAGRGGQANPNGFDCSGLTYWAYQRAGVQIPGTADSQWRGLRAVSGTPQAGDLVFFNFGRLGSGRADHVGLYLGNGQFLQAPRRGSQVQISNLSGSYQSHLMGFRRP